MKHYKNAKTEEERNEIETQIKEQIKNSLVIVKKKGMPVVAISLQDSTLPLYKLGVRTRGIGNAQTLEIAQEVFGSLSLKNGNTDVSSWDLKDRKTVVDAESFDLIKSIENDGIDFTNLDEKNSTLNRIQQLKKWYPNSTKLINSIKLLESMGIEIK